MDTVTKVKNSNLFFMHFNSTFPNECDGKLEFIIGFGNPSLFRLLRGYKRMFIDGTFKFVPKPFYKCLIIMVFDEQTYAYKPVFYVLMTSKIQQVYPHARSWLEATINHKISPSSITCDFEIALQNTITANFPGVAINGCLFHWKQAIQRKIIYLKFKENVCERMMWSNTLELLTIINPSEIKWKGIPYV